VFETLIVTELQFCKVTAAQLGVVFCIITVVCSSRTMLMSRWRSL